MENAPEWKESTATESEADVSEFTCNVLYWGLIENVNSIR